MKTAFTLIASCFFFNHSFCQKSKFSFSAEVVPYARMEGSRADGSQFSINYYLNDKTSLRLTYGLRKQAFQLTLPIPIVIIGNDTMPLADIKTEETIFTPDEKLNGAVFNPYTVATYRALGFKHFEPKDGYRQQNFLTIEALRQFKLSTKIDAKIGIGGGLGIFNRTEWTAALNSKVNYLGEEIETWINYRITLRYLYYGMNGRVEFDRKINDHFSVGIISGTQLVMSRKFSFSQRDLMVHYFSLAATFLI